MIINSLKMSGFRIVGELVDVKFPEEGRIGIIGQNECGKTTFLQAIEYALYGLRKGIGVEGERENLITWGKNEAKLEIEFTSGQDTYILQRIFGAKAGHRASLTPVINGVKDKSNSTTSLKDIEARIEQITGMDRDSFSKLIYIRQKDLDALRELAKSKREQLVNKVMGIEVFDDALANVKTYVSSFRNDFEGKNLRLQNVRRNKEQYETKQGQKTKLESSIDDLKIELKQKEGQVEEAKKLLEKYDWLFASNSKKDVTSSLNERLSRVQEDIEKIATLEEEIKRYKATLTKYKPKVEELENLQNIFADLERRLTEAEDNKKSIEAQRQTVIAKTKLRSNDLALLSQDLQAKKRHFLIYFVLGLMASFGVVFVGLVTNLILVTIFSLLFFGLSAYLFYYYLKIDKLVTANSEVNSLTTQLEAQTSKISGLEAEIGKATAETSFKNSGEVSTRLSGIVEEVKTITGHDSILGIEAVARNVNKTLNELKDSNPSKKKEELEEQIRAKKKEIADLQSTKPVSVDELHYEKEQHELAKENFETLQDGYNKMDKEIGSKLATIQQLSLDLEGLKSDYDLYPVLEQEVQTCQNKIMLLERVSVELAETSKELRNKVIPHARFIINSILPTLTAERYSDLEITEDLKFKVHSNEAGGYKEREIFSGGTQDQFLIALRLAFTQSILDSRVMADRYCLLMDECISSSDDVRKQGIFEVLDVMKKTFSQIFVIAHEDISNYVDNHIILARNDHGYAEIKSRSW